MKDSSDHKDQESTDPNLEKNVSDKSEDGESILLNYAKETLDTLRRSSMLAPENDSELDDEEHEAKLKTVPPEVKSSQRRQTTSQIVSKMISDDIEKAYQSSKRQKEEKNDKNLETAHFDPEHASLMGAVLGIGERDKSKDDVHKTEVPSNHSMIGTLAGLGDVTDEDADLSESHSTQTFKEELVESPQMEDSSKDIKNQKQDKPSTSHKHLQDVKDSKKSEKSSPKDSKQSEKSSPKDSKKSEKSSKKEEGGLMGIFRSIKKKFLDKD